MDMTPPVHDPSWVSQQLGVDEEAEDMNNLRPVEHAHGDDDQGDDDEEDHEDTDVEESESLSSDEDKLESLPPSPLRRFGTLNTDMSPPP